MFLHLIHTDEKFLGPIRRVFEAVAPGRNEYVFVGISKAGYVPPPDVRVVSNAGGFLRVIDGRSDWEGVLVHGVPFHTMRPIVDLLPNAMPIAWYVWGFEAYEHWPPLKKGLLMRETRRVASRLAGPAWHRFLRPRRLASLHSREIPMVASRYRFCVAPFHEERDLFAASGILKHTQYHWGSYGSLEDYVDVREEAISGEDCQVGNSASLTNNHLDAFPLLRGTGRTSRNILVPLSYGDPRYRDEVIAAGRAQFGKRFHPLVDFVPPSEYATLLRSCGHVVMNHERQQAVGNILPSLWRGACVYMNDTTLYRALRRLGFDVKLIQASRSKDGRLEMGRLPQAQVERHRDLLREHCDRRKVVRETGDLLERLRAN